jgi:hypothetical protein
MIMEPEIISLPIFDITVTLNHVKGSKDIQGGTFGTITSNLKDGEPGDENPEFDASMDAIESMILAYAVAGGEIGSSQFQTAIMTAVEAVANHN